MQVNDSNYRERIAKGEHVILMWRAGCPACERLRPQLHEVARQRQQVWFTMLSSLGNPKFRDEFKVDRVPTLLRFENGKLMGKLTGAFPSAEIIQWLDHGGVLQSKDTDCEFCSAVRGRLRPWFPRLVKWIERYA